MLLVLYKICCSCCSNISEQQNSNKNGVIYYCLMLLMCWLKAFYCIHLLCGSICNKLIISDLCILFPDAAYRTTWIWKSCVLNGRKAFSRLFFRSKNRPFCCTFHLNQNQRENSLFTSEVHLFSIRCEGTKISGIFTNWCQLKARCSHEDFAAKRINRQYHW